MAACLVAWPAAALLTRPDRDDAEYLELASRYTSSIALAANAGEAVLIAPRWLLTGARQAQALKGTPALDIGGARHEIQSIHVDPSRTVALVFLRVTAQRTEYPTSKFAIGNVVTARITLVDVRRGNGASSATEDRRDSAMH